MNADELQILNDHYVAQVNWLVCRGRDDLIDVIADEYERDLHRLCRLRRRDASSAAAA